MNQQRKIGNAIHFVHEYNVVLRNNLPGQKVPIPIEITVGGAGFRVDPNQAVVLVTMNTIVSNNGGPVRWSAQVIDKSATGNTLNVECYVVIDGIGNEEIAQMTVSGVIGI